MSAPARPARRRAPVWPIWVLAAPAAVSIWAGWVGLGQLTGFGVVQLLPGIWDELRINTAITLPIGMEAYAAYAMYVWLATDAPKRAKEFARGSALGALLLGALGQMAYHLMAAASIAAAPWPVTAAVSCLPVGVLGMAAALAHLVRSEEDARDEAEQATSPPAPVTSPVSQLFRNTAPAPAPVGPVTTPAFRAVPNWSATATVDRSTDQSPGRTTDRPADRSGGPVQTGPPDRSTHAPAGRPANRSGRAARSGSTRQSGKQTGKPRTDAQLAAAVRELAEANGGVRPSQYQLKQQFGIGSTRAARLLADLSATTGLVASPANNGAGTRKEGSR